tara:strand:+ start:156 stop:410 length:255 start_codon:yes stop_codon:yes gene_type:complete
MRKLIGIFSLCSLLAFTACNQNSESSSKKSDVKTPVAIEATPVVQETEYAAHECSDKCTAEGCYHAHGEQEHVCDDNCHFGHNH